MSAPLSTELRELADYAPMSMGTRTKLRALANKIEVFERDNEVVTDLARKMLNKQSPETQPEKP